VPYCPIMDDTDGVHRLCNMYYQEDIEKYGAPADSGKTVSSVTDRPADQVAVKRMASRITPVALEEAERQRSLSPPWQEEEPRD
jgi:hypothetical protein